MLNLLMYIGEGNVIDCKMSSAQDPFYIVKEEIQESVSFLSGFLIFVATSWRKETFVDLKSNGHINVGS